MQLNQSKSQISSDTKPVRSFNEIVCQAIDQTLEELLGPKAVEAIYVLLNRKFGVDRNELPYRVPTIRFILEDMFGVKGMHVIERKVAKNLYDRLLLPFNDEQGLTLEDYLKLCKETISHDSYYV
jgi:hypothetical protein